MNSTSSLVEVENLRISFPSPTGDVVAVKSVSFCLGTEKLGIVGESGSGKSVTGRALLKLLPKYASVNADKIEFKGQDIFSLREKGMRKIRGREIAMVMQDPKYSLNPIMTVGAQISEAYRIHHQVSKKQGRLKSLAMLEAVRIRNPEKVYRLYPHEISGGMGQRVMIAMMLIPEPSVLIADEPSSALDVTVQLQVLAILDDLVSQRGMGLIFISHDIGLVTSFCDRIVVMYRGKIMETVDADKIHLSTHPYTQGLLQCMPKIEHERGSLPVLQRRLRRPR